MKKWDKREKQNSFISGFLKYLDFGRMYEGGRIKRFFANVIMLNGVFFIGMTAFAFINYGLAWLAWSSNFRTP